MKEYQLTLSAEWQTRFKAYFSERGGLYFKDHDLRNLDEAVGKRMKALGLESVIAYYQRITNSPEKENEFRELMNLLTVNHTYFFRNLPHFRALKEKVLPELIANKREKALCQNSARPQIRIWSAGCSSGEEPYTIAMVLKECLRDTDVWDIEILATDASTDILQKASRGVYRKSSVKFAEPEILDRYFDQTAQSQGEGEYVIRDEIKKMVKFRYHNLVEEHFDTGFDIIFCRNVVIYFDVQTTDRIMREFHRSLQTPGYLFIGYSESLLSLSDKFRLTDWEEAIYYTKIDGQALAQQPLQKPAKISKQPRAEDLIDEIRGRELLDKYKAHKKRAGQPAALHYEDLLLEAKQDLKLRQYAEAAQKAEKCLQMRPESIEAFGLAAEGYLNQGDLAAARKKLEEALKKDAFFTPAYYLLGCICLEDGSPEKAKNYFRKALFNDGKFLLAHFYMAHLHKQEGRQEESIREYRNTLRLLSDRGAEETIDHSGGFQAIALKSVCRSNIERLKTGEMAA